MVDSDTRSPTKRVNEVMTVSVCEFGPARYPTVYVCLAALTSYLQLSLGPSISKCANFEVHDIFNTVINKRI